MTNYYTMYPNTFSSGEGLVFDISNIENIPWVESDNDVKHQLERLYALRSSNKVFVSTFEQIPAGDRAKMVAAMFTEKWEKIWNDFNEEYNPLHGYVVNESEQRHREYDDEKTTTYGRNTQVTGTDTGTITDVIDEEISGTSNIYGYNSVSPVPADTSGEQTDSTSTQTRDLATGSSTVNSGNDREESDGQEDVTATISKTGNIGYSSPQSLLKQDIELWARPYFDMVFADIDSLIMLQVY